MSASTGVSGWGSDGRSAGAAARATLADTVTSGAHLVAASLTEPCGPNDRDEWLSVAGSCQALINTLTAVQDTALAEVARRESDWCEDGTLGETVHGHGRITLDAADLAAPVLGASHGQAQRRVELAVRLATGRAPVEADGRATPEANGLDGIHAAMADGRLDGYRASVVADELELAPADVADAVVSALDPHLDDDAPALRRRARRLLARISPDLLRQRAARARASTGLRRWVAEPGVDAWFGTFPSEDAARAWAAIDRLAHELVAAGTCSSVEQARGRALTDLVTGNSTIDVQVVLTVPADSTSWHGSRSDCADEVEAAGPLVGVDVMRAGKRPQGTPSPEPHAPDEDVVDQAGPRRLPSISPVEDEDLLQVQGPRPSEPLLVPRGWLLEVIADPSAGPRSTSSQARPVIAPCHPLTGARLDPDDRHATDAYRPGATLAALVRARDGRCRFPGCGVAARFCDLDHVRPWPAGRTAGEQLLTLCRRHHRVKQRPGWRLRLDADATAIWTDPTGRVRTTLPLDALEVVVLRADRAEVELDDPARGDGGPAYSVLETLHEFRLEHGLAAVERHDGARALRHRRCTSAADLREGLARRHHRAPLPDLPPF